MGSYKNIKNYYDELLSKYKNKTKTTRKIIKKWIWNNNCQNEIKYLNINNTITKNPQEIANTFNDYFLTVLDTVMAK
jgi:hypothetical protein